MTKADRQELCERLEQAGVHLEQASHAWFQYLLLQQTREDYSVRQASLSALPVPTCKSLLCSVGARQTRIFSGACILNGRHSLHQAD